MEKDIFSILGKVWIRTFTDHFHICNDPGTFCLQSFLPPQWFAINLRIENKWHIQGKKFHVIWTHRCGWPDLNTIFTLAHTSLLKIFTCTSIPPDGAFVSTQNLLFTDFCHGWLLAFKPLLNCHFLPEAFHDLPYELVLPPEWLLSLLPCCILFIAQTTTVILCWYLFSCLSPSLRM